MFLNRLKCVQMNFYSNKSAIIFFAADKLQCYVCSSDTLEACSSEYQKHYGELPFESCPSNVLSCYMKVESNWNHVSYEFIHYTFFLSFWRFDTINWNFLFSIAIFQVRNRSTVESWNEITVLYFSWTP